MSSFDGTVSRLIRNLSLDEFRQDAFYAELRSTQKFGLGALLLSEVPENMRTSSPGARKNLYAGDSAKGEERGGGKQLRRKRPVVRNF